MSRKSRRCYDDRASVFDEERTCLMLDDVLKSVVLVDPVVVVIDLVAFEGAVPDLEELISAKS